jgi:hypothetical protein
MLGLEHGEELLRVQPLGVLEVNPHPLGEGLVSLRDDVEKIPNGHDLPEL